MTIEIRHFRRRNIIERMVLHIMRGKSLQLILKSRDTDRHILVSDALDEYDALCFLFLRELSIRCGLAIMPIDAQYLSVSELCLLRWLAERQRHVGLRSVHIEDIDFRTTF